MNGKSLLVVDDSATFRRLLCLSLTRIEGISEQNITQADNGAEALSKLRAGSFDLVLTDINMPEMSGLELVQAVRQDLDNKQLPIVIISTRGSEVEVEKGIELGASGYLSKPISMSQLRDVVVGLLCPE
ncbi:MAG: response regulator [Blastocatellia bacterium]